MKTKTLEESTFKVKEDKKKIIVSHLEDKTSFAHPAFKGTYDSVGEQIEENGLLKPTPEEIASLVYFAYQNLDDEYAKEIKNMMRNHGFWMFNTIKYVPNKGAYIQKPDKEIFVPFGYKIGEQSALELSKNKFVIGLFGEEGADKIARIADTYFEKPYLFSFENVDKEVTGKSALGDGWNLDIRLGVVGGNWNHGEDGRAFGVIP